MGREPCDGYVSGLAGHQVQCTGKAHIALEWVKRDALHAQIRAHGGRITAGTQNAEVSLLVVGDLPRIVTDPIYERSKSLRYAERQRSAGNHVCIVDDFGISSLLRGEPAPCLQSRGVDAETVALSLPTPPARVVPDLAPLTIGDEPVRDPVVVEMTFEGLDKGTSAHQATLRLVRDVVPELLRLGSPRVDAAWKSASESGLLFIAEVKSLSDGREVDQIRLGMGQLADYATAVRRNPPAGITKLRPVLILSREPSDVGHWLESCRSIDQVLTWAPDFVGLPR